MFPLARSEGMRQRGRNTNVRSIAESGIFYRAVYQALARGDHNLSNVVLMGQSGAPAQSAMPPVVPLGILKEPHQLGPCRLGCLILARANI